MEERRNAALRVAVWPVDSSFDECGEKFTSCSGRDQCAAAFEYCKGTTTAFFVAGPRKETRWLEETLEGGRLLTTQEGEFTSTSQVKEARRGGGEWKDT